MSRTGPDAGRYCPISPRNRWRRIQNRTQQYARTTGSSYAAMIRLMMLARIHDVAIPSTVHPVAREPAPKTLERLDASIPAGRPSALEQHDELRRARIEGGDELVAEPRNDPRVLIVIEVEGVEKEGRLDGAQAQERGDTGVSLVQD